MTQSPITGREPRLAAETHSKGVQRLSLRRLGTMLNLLPPSAISVEAAAEAIKSEDYYVRFNAAKALGKRGDRDARIVMENALKQGDPRTRASIARHLHGFSWFSAESLIRLALKDADSRVRECAVYALCDLRELDAYKLLTEVLQNEEDNVREAAAWGLRDCQDPAAVPVLEAALKAKDPDVRIKALESLGTNDTPQAMPVVREAMNDPDPAVKYSATLSLLELAGEAWLEELAGVIGRASGITLEQVLKGFFHATNYLKINVAKSTAAELMIDALETALLDETDKARMAAVWPLAWMRHERTPMILKRTYLIEQNSAVKAHIVRVAAGLMSSVSEEILEDALQSQEDEVRRAAEQIMADRERAGFVLTYDENAKEGSGLKKPVLGR